MNLPLVKIAQNLNVAVSTVHRIYRSMRHRKSFEYAVFLPGSADISDSNVQTSNLYALYANLCRIRVTGFANGTAIDCTQVFARFSSKISTFWLSFSYCRSGHWN